MNDLTPKTGTGTALAKWVRANMVQCEFDGPKFVSGKESAGPGVRLGLRGVVAQVRAAGHVKFLREIVEINTKVEVKKILDDRDARRASVRPGIAFVGAKDF